MTKKQAGIIAALSFASIILVMLTFARAGSKLWLRADLTKAKQYTISPVSRNLYTEIDEPVRITYYITDKLSGITPVPGEIKDLLEEYAQFSHDRIKVSSVDPAKADLEDLMAQIGIPGQQIQTVEKDEATVSIVYTGIFIEYLDKSDIIPVVFSLDTLEYDLTSRIRSLVRGEARELGVMIPNASKTLENGYQLLNQYFTASGYKVRVIAPGSEIPTTLSALIVAGGVEDFDDWSLYRLDYYIQGGGKVIFTVDYVGVNLQGGISAREYTDTGLLSMLESYGVTVKRSLVLDMSAQTTTVQQQDNRGRMIYRMIRYPFWVNVMAENGNTAHPITNRFDGANLFWASPLELRAPSGIEAVPLFSTTPDAWLQTKDFNVNPDQSWAWTTEQDATLGSKPVSAALSGKFKAYYANKDKPAREGSEETLPDLPAMTEDARIIVIGDADFASDDYSQNDRRNMNFLVQAADWISNENDIISIHNRAGGTPRLDKIADPVKRAAAFNFARSLNVVVIPLLVIAAGVAVSLGRYRKTKKEEN
jgi:gliding-associated putative ABC transporter substrate-binding component GldG